MECPALTTAGLSAVTSASGSPRRARRWCRLRILDVEAEQVLVGTPRRLIQVLMKLPLITLLDGEHSLHASLSILHSSLFTKSVLPLLIFRNSPAKLPIYLVYSNISAIFFFYLSST